jgi:NAD-dependent DNA ligase
MRRKTLNYDSDQDLIRKYNNPLMLRRSVQEMQGIAAAIIYDGQIDDTEIQQLDQWIDAHKAFSKEWPLSKVRDCLYQILEDGEVTAEERQRLYQCLSDFAADPRRGAVVDGVFDEDPAIVFEDRQFLFTGLLQFGPRKKAELAVIERGGIVSKSKRPSQSLHYLIVGDFGSESWAYSRFGLKINEAMVLRKGCRPPRPLIVRERVFVKAVLATG